MLEKSNPNGILVLVAGMILMLVLGSVHAFSVFLEPLEQRFSASRSQVSMIYSLALVALTLSVLFGHHIYRRFRPASLFALICVLAAIGCLLAAIANSLYTVLLGYSLMFGAPNGLGYGFALESSAQANPGIKGLAMGIITACYALGAVISPLFFEALVTGYGFSGAMIGLALVLVVITPLTAGLIVKSKVELRFLKPQSGEQPMAQTPSDRMLVIKLWLGYGTAVSAGLMAIGHATGIARSGNLSDALVLSAPIIIAVFNMIGSFLGGWLSDRATNRQMLMAFPILSSAALFMLALIEGEVPILTSLASLGSSYGAITAVYPIIVGTLYEPVDSVQVYGRVFTAWGIAGLLAPVLAGFLYEQTGNYQTALIVAGCAGLTSLIAVWTIPQNRETLTSPQKA